MSKKQELNEFLAEEIMGWEFRAPDWAKPDKEDDYPGSDFKCWHDPEAENLEELNITNEKYLYPDGSNNLWNPLENLEQAFECLEQYIKNTKIEPTVYQTQTHERWNVKLVDNDADKGYEDMYDATIGWGMDEKLPKAIIRAILKAESKFEEFEECF